MKEWWLSKEKNDIFATIYYYVLKSKLAQYVHEYLHSYKENFLHTTNFFKIVHPINSQKPCNNIARTFECSKNRKKIWIFFLLYKNWKKKKLCNIESLRQTAICTFCFSILKHCALILSFTRFIWMKKEKQSVKCSKKMYPLLQPILISCRIWEGLCYYIEG